MFQDHRFRRRRSAGIIAAGVAVTFLLAACGSTDSTTAAASGEPSNSAGDASIRLGMELLVAGLPFTAEIQAGGDAAAKETGVVLDVSAPSTFDPPAAISQVNNFLSSGVNGLAIAPEPAPLWTRALTDAVTKTNGNTVALQTPPPAGTTVKTYVGVDATELGRQIAAEAIKSSGLGPDTTGEVIIGQCTTQSTPLTQTTGGMAEAVKQALPQATVLDPFDSNSVPAQNFAAWEQEMRAHPDAVLVLGSCDQDGESMVKAKQVTGGTWAIGATATTPGVLAAIADGTVASSVAQNWYVAGYTVVRLLAEGLQHNTTPVEGWINPGTTVITKANVAEIVARDASPEGQAAFYKPLVTKLWADLGAATKPLTDAQTD